MHILAVTAFLYVLAVLFAAFEIEAEGKYGWGEKFPTWYRVSGFVARVYGTFTNKPLTGYHAALFFVPIMVFLWPMVATSTMSWHGVLSALSAYFAWVVVWDYSWFIMNPHYGVKKFRRNNVWWFSRELWIGPVPEGYIAAWMMSLLLAAVSGLVGGGWAQAVTDQLQQLGWYLVAVVLAIFTLGPLYSRYYNAMRQHDERSEAGIFH